MKKRQFMAAALGASGGPAPGLYHIAVSAG